jgi:hypothetical protein
VIGRCAWNLGLQRGAKQCAGHRDERDPSHSYSIHLLKRSTLSRSAASSARSCSSSASSG